MVLRINFSAQMCCNIQNITCDDGDWLGCMIVLEGDKIKWNHSTPVHSCLCIVYLLLKHHSL